MVPTVIAGTVGAGAHWVTVRAPSEESAMEADR